MKHALHSSASYTDQQSRESSVSQPRSGVFGWHPEMDVAPKTVTTIIIIHTIYIYHHHSDHDHHYIHLHYHHTPPSVPQIYYLYIIYIQHSIIIQTAIITMCYSLICVHISKGTLCYIQETEKLQC